MSSDLISVVIPSGRPARVDETVRSLLAQNIDRKHYEIIVVTPEPGLLQDWLSNDVRVAATGVLFPPGRMRNIGAREAKGKYLCFIDDDCLAPEKFLESLIHILKTHDRVGAVGCRVVALDGTFWNKCADHALFTAYQLKKSGVVGGLGSAALVVKREAFEATGGFDELLMASEDWDFSLKLRRQGWLCWFVPETEVLHDHRRGSFKAIIRSAWQYGKASGLTVQQRHWSSVSWVSKVLVFAERYKLYVLLIIPYGCFLTIVWLVETRPSNTLFFLPFIFIARLSYQMGVFRSFLR